MPIARARHRVAVSTIAALALLAPATTAAGQTARPASADTLRGVAPLDLYVGVAAAGGGHHLNQDYPDPITQDEGYRARVAAEFSSLTPENQTKWDHLRPDEGTFDFDDADEIVDFAEANGQVVRGHTLLWHSQNPAWLEQGDHTPEQLRELLREHIHTVVGRYAGRIHQWEVANEIFDDNAELRDEDNIWIRELGPEIVADAFRWAHEADPNAELFFNDYNVEGINDKSTAYYELIQELLADDVPVHGFGAQGHLGLQYGIPGDIRENLQRFGDLGLATAITEIDVRMVLPDSGQPTAAQLAEQADWYSRALQACIDVESCGSFTVWGLTDAHSWVPGTFEGEGAALITDDDYRPKPAYFALHRTLLDALPTFPDLGTGGPHERHVRTLARDGAIAGHRDGTFRPLSSISRGQFASILAGAAGVPTEGRTARFSDTAGSVHEGAIAALTEAGVIDGFPDGTFRPQQPVSRGQVARLLSQWLDLPPAGSGPFTDVSGDLAPHVNSLHAAGVIVGVTDTTFAPNRNTRRDQAATLLSRARTLAD